MSMQKETNNLDYQVLKDAVEKFGELPQIIMAMEEMSELTQALSKYIRGKDNQDNIAEEIADVYIMLSQLMLMFNNGYEVDEYIGKKIKRLKEMLENE